MALPNHGPIAAIWDKARNSSRAGVYGAAGKGHGVSEPGLFIA